MPLMSHLSPEEIHFISFQKKKEDEGREEKKDVTLEEIDEEVERWEKRLKRKREAFEEGKK